MLEYINENVVSVLTPWLLLIAGIYFSVRLKFFYLRHPIKIVKSMFKKNKNSGTSPFRALTVALAGTLGVGNIVGVASSIAIGGYGSVFWMWVSALIAMVLKYAEIVLAINHRRRDPATGEYHGGASYYIKDYFNSRGKRKIGLALALIFSFLCIANSVTMGCIIQSNAISSSFSGVFGARLLPIGLAIAILSYIIISGNADFIGAFCQRIVPAMTVGYILLSVAALSIAGKERLLDAFSLIFNNAFELSSVGGGVIGFLFSRGLRAGTMRGLMSNEAGCGTAPTAHAAADTDSAVKQGFLGLVEVFVDTVLLCTLTALVIIVAGERVLSFGNDPMMMAIESFSTLLGAWSRYYMCLSVFLFAFATIICWAHYGKESVLYFSKKKVAIRAYTIGFSAFALFGALSAPQLAWTVADLALGVMTVINLIVLFLMSGEVAESTEKYFNDNS